MSLRHLVLLDEVLELILSIVSDRDLRVVKSGVLWSRSNESVRFGRDLDIILILPLDRLLLESCLCPNGIRC